MVVKDLMAAFKEEKTKRLKNPLLSHFAKLPNGAIAKKDVVCGLVERQAAEKWNKAKDFVAESSNFVRSLSDGKGSCEVRTIYADVIAEHAKKSDKEKQDFIDEMTDAVTKTSLKAVQMGCKDGLAKMGERLAAPSNNAFLEDYLKCHETPAISDQECKKRRGLSPGLCFIQVAEKDSAEAKQLATSLGVMTLMSLSAVAMQTSLVAAVFAAGVDVAGMGFAHAVEDRVAPQRAVSGHLLHNEKIGLGPDEYADAIASTDAAGRRRFFGGVALDALFFAADLGALKLAIRLHNGEDVVGQLKRVIKNNKAYQQAPDAPIMPFSKRLEQSKIKAVDEAIERGTDADSIKKIVEDFDKTAKTIIAKERRDIKASVIERLKGSAWKKADIDQYLSVVDKMGPDEISSLSQIENKANKTIQRRGLVKQVEDIMRELYAKIKNNVPCKKPTI
jgi:hypothetical protein